MAKIITQDTFDDVVKENIVDFSMTPDEAREETIKQFEKQGINLANIIQDLSINEETGTPILNESIDRVKAQINAEFTPTIALLEDLEVLQKECDKSTPHRVLAGKNGAHEILISLLGKETAGLVHDNTSDTKVLQKCLQAINSLHNKQPDLFDIESLTIALKLLSISTQSNAIISLTLQWMQKACIMHEINRQNIMNSNIIKVLKPFVYKEYAEIIREVLALFRYLVLDDDIRVEFGCAHEHARLLANEFLEQLTKLLDEFDDINIVADLILTIGTLAVRVELCKTVYEAGGIKSIFEIMRANINSPRICRESLKLLRALGGNDYVKAHIVQNGVAPIIKDVLLANASNDLVVAAGLACISKLTLRVKDNSLAFFETGIAETIVELVRLYPKNKTIQRNAAWAIRNMVSRSREQCDVWLSYGVEDLLNASISEHPSINQDIKAALRDLGCNVTLREEWTGTAQKKIAN